MRLWGYWHAKTIGKDLPDEFHRWRETRHRMVGLALPIQQHTAWNKRGMMEEAAAWVRVKSSHAPWPRGMPAPLLTTRGMLSSLYFP